MTQLLKLLKQKIANLQAKADELEQAEKPGIRQLRTVMRKFKLGSTDLKVALDGQSRNGRRSKLAGRKVKPKYRNPDKKSQTWTGRGRMPVWMVALLKKGKKRDDFLIKT